MIKGLASSEASMRPKMARLEVLANNLANINSTGFKRDRVFVELLKESAVAQAQGKGDLEGVKVTQYTDFSEGSLQQTGNPLDLALQGRGFFVVDTPRGQRYTRNGNFKLSTDGSLITSEGYSVQGDGGKIRFPDIRKLQEGKVAISDTGEITLDREQMGHLRVVDFADLTRLQKDHQSFFMAEPGNIMMEGPGNGTAVRQGYLEESNVEGIEEMITMIELNRNFETDQKVIQAQDATIDKSLEVGRL